MTQTYAEPSLYKLQRVLDSESTRQEVAEALVEAEQLGDGLPELLAYRAKERIDAERMVERRRMILVIVSVVGLFGTIVGGFGLTTLQKMRSIDRSANQLQGLIESEQWDAADQYLKSLDESTQSQPELLEATDLVEQKLRERKDRDEEFSRIARELQAKSIDRWGSSKVERLQAIARTDEQRRTAEAFFAKFEEQRLTRQANKADEQTQEFEVLQDELDQFLTVEMQAMTESDRQKRRLELRHTLNRFVATHNLANPELAAVARQSVEMLSQEEEEGQKRLSRDALVEATTRSIGNLEKYFGSLAELVETFPSDPMTKELEQARLARNAAEATTRWIGVLKHEAYQRPESADERTSEYWLASYQLAFADGADHPFGNEARRWRDHYVALARRGELIKRLKKAFGESLMKPMYVYPGTDGRQYYSLRAPENTSRGAHVVPAFQDLGLRIEEKNFGFAYKTDVFPKVRPAGHSRYGSSVANAVASISAKDFTPSMYRLLNDLRTFESDPAFDPLYRLVWLRRLLQIGSEGSVPIKRAFDALNKKVDALDVEWLGNWIDPESAKTTVEQSRQMAQLFLEEIEGWESAVQKMLAEFRAFRSPRDAAPRWIGWVTRDNENHFATLAEDPKGQPIFVVTVDPNQKVTVVKVNVNESSNVITDPAAQKSGAMICVCPASPQDPS